MEKKNMYEDSKIYVITDIDYNERYYGSTVQPLTKRFIEHKSKYNLYKNKNTGCYISLFSIFDKYTPQNTKIELVESFPCTSKAELEAREGYHIKQDSSAVNRIVPGRTKREYYQDYHDEILEYRKQYRENFPDKIREQKR